MSDIDDLISDLEHAEKGSRDLDRRIDLLLNPGSWLWSPEWYSGGKNDFLRWPDEPVDRPDWPDGSMKAKYRQVRRYTTSMDSAYLILEEGWSCDIHIGPRDMASEATVYVPHEFYDDKSRRCTEFKEHQAKSVRDGVMHWQTAPLALCIAALKARRAATQEHS